MKGSRWWNHFLQKTSLLFVCLFDHSTVNIAVCNRSFRMHIVHDQTSEPSGSRRVVLYPHSQSRGHARGQGSVSLSTTLLSDEDNSRVGLTQLWNGWVPDPFEGWRSQTCEGEEMNTILLKKKNPTQRKGIFMISFDINRNVIRLFYFLFFFRNFVRHVFICFFSYLFFAW